MNNTVKDFYTKPTEGYIDNYEKDHGPRLDAVIEHYEFKNLKNSRILDVGGGLGFLGKRLDSTNEYWVIDGSDVEHKQRLCKGRWIKADIDHKEFGSDDVIEVVEFKKVYGFNEYSGLYHLVKKDDFGKFDACFLLETIEHCGNPHHVIDQIKKLVKIDGTIIVSIPDESVWHNTPYPGLLWPPENFAQFLGQMALTIVDFWHYKPKIRGWPAYHFKCINRPYRDKVMLYPKQEAKFLDANPVEMTNL